MSTRYSKMDESAYYLLNARRRADYKYGDAESLLSQGSWEALPQELLTMIINYCDSKTRKTGRMLCKRWCHHIDAECKVRQKGSSTASRAPNDMLRWVYTAEPHFRQGLDACIAIKLIKCKCQVSTWIVSRCGEIAYCTAASSTSICCPPSPRAFHCRQSLSASRSSIDLCRA